VVWLSALLRCGFPFSAFGSMFTVAICFLLRRCRSLYTYSDPWDGIGDEVEKGPRTGLAVVEVKGVHRGGFWKRRGYKSLRRVTRSGEAASTSIQHSFKRAFREGGQDKGRA
jgi:hypothetical protein